MRWLSALRERYRALVFRDREDRELDEELAFHLEMAEAENLRRGMSPEEARRQAALQLGGVTQVREATREARGVRWLDDLATDLRFTLRTLRRAPLFSLLVVTTLALGVGAASVVFGLADQVLLSPLPGVEDTGAAAYLEFRSADEPEFQRGIPPIDFVELRREATALEGIAAYGRATLIITAGSSRPLSVTGSMVHGDYFEVLGVRPAIGRLLRAEDTGFDAEPLVAVISERLWGTLFQRSEDVVGRTMQVNGKAVTVIGVAGRGFAGAERYDEIDAWLPLSALVPLVGFDRETLRSPGSTMHSDLVARPREGVPLRAAEAQIAQILRRMAAAHPENAEYLAALRPHLYGGLYTTPLSRATTYRSLAMLGGVVGLLLLIACANAANLLMFRGLTRKGELAVRRALGASGGRVARQEIVASLILAALGAAMGIAVGWFLAWLFRGDRVLFRAEEFPGLTFDIRLLGFAVGMVVVMTLLFGILPAVLVSRVNLLAALREASRQETHRRAWVRYAASAAQVALCVPLLVGALLLTRTVRNLNSVDLGMSPEGLVTAGVFAGGAGLDAFKDPERHRALLEALVAQPGIASAALEFSGVFSSTFSAPTRLPEAPSREQVMANTDYVSPGWFELLGIRAVAGRTFQPQDWRPGAPVRAVITAPLARRLFGRQDVVGRTLLSGGSSPIEAEIVGVVGEIRSRGPSAEPSETVFLSYSEHPPFPMVNVLVRPRHFDASTVQQIQEAFDAVFPGYPAPEPALLTDRIDRQLAARRLLAGLLRLVSVLAVVLAGVGLYGVVSFVVASRRRELGIRIALGASGSRIARLVLGQAAASVGAGLLVGIGSALLLVRFLESQLFGVSPTDAIAYAAPVCFFAAVTLLACWRPLHSATHVDPARTLREG
jgi:predicted permease